ncbi:MAG: GAF domain-containing protein [Bacteroidota bacterium]
MMLYIVIVLVSLTLVWVVGKVFPGWVLQPLANVIGEVPNTTYKYVENPKINEFVETGEVVNEYVTEKEEEKRIEDTFNEQHLNSGFDAINKLFLQNSTSEDINQLVLNQLCKQIKCYHAALYKTDEEKEQLSLISGYGLTKSKDKLVINYGDGMVGQAVLDNEQITLRDVPQGYIKVASGLGQIDPLWIGVFPLSFKGKAYGVIELCFLYQESEIVKGHLEKVAELFGAHFFNQKVQAKQSQLQQLEEEKMRSEAILEGCADGFIGFDRNGLVDFCNKSAAELIRLDKRDILGQNIRDLLNVSIEQSDENTYTLIHHGLEEMALSEKTEIQITDSYQEEITVLVTANTISVADDILFTLFLQKISVDLF